MANSRKRTAAGKPKRQEMTTFPLRKVPADLLLKFQLPELVQLRNAEKFFDHFVEEKRLHIGAAVNEKIYLFIQTDSSRSCVHFQLVSMGYGAEWMEFGMHTPNKLSSCARSAISMTGTRRSAYELKKPYTQLSAMRFQLIVLCLDEWSVSATTQKNYLDNSVIPLLKKLQLSCEQFQLDVGRRIMPASVKPALECVKTSKISFAAMEISKSDYTHLNLKDYSEVYLESIKGKPEHLKDYIGNATTVSLTFSCGGVENLLYSFLEEIKESQTARGNLEELVVKFHPQNTATSQRNFREFLENSLDAELIFQDRVCYYFEDELKWKNLRFAQFYKVPIDQGLAIILTFNERPDYYSVHLIDRYTKPAVMEILNPYLSVEQDKIFIRQQKFTPMNPRKRKQFYYYE